MTDRPDFGETLYRILPQLYRTRDRSGDLRAFTAGCGALLDAVYATLRQRYADNFPDAPPEGTPIPPAQDWLLPYFAELVDARLVSPLVAGRRAELANAIRWRQGKGTLAVVDGIVEAIGQTQAVVQEGWQRVATTPRLDRPLRPATAFGYSRAPEPANPGSAARHPDLPAATVDLRCPSRAIAADASTPGARRLEIDGRSHVWRQGSVHGAPCFPGSYEDTSPRTVDLRSPDWRVGHAHPRRVIAYLPPPSGFFPPDAPAVAWRATPRADYLDAIDVDDSTPGVIVHRAKTLGTPGFVPVRVTGNVNLDAAGAPRVWRFEGLAFERRVRSATARLEFRRCAVQAAATEAAGTDGPVLDLADSLAERVTARNGLARLVGVTVLARTAVRAIQASDSVFAGPIAAAPSGGAPPPDGGCVRYSRIAPDQPDAGLRLFETTTDAPHFVEPGFGRRHAGVLLPASGDAILTGAEDEGELGAFHHARHAALRAAILAKLADFLPVGMQAVLVPDSRLTQPPYDPAAT